MRRMVLFVMAVVGVAWGQEEPDRITSIEVPHSIGVIAWSPDGTKIAVGGGESPCAKENEDTDRFDILIVDVQTMSAVRRLSGFTCRVNDIEWSPDGTRIAAASGDALGFRVWDAVTGEVIAVSQVGGQGISAVKWHPTQHELLVGSVSGTSATFDALTGELINRLNAGHNADWNPEGTLILWSGYGNTIEVLDPVTSEMKLSFQVEPANVVDWSPDGSNLASAGINGRVRVWNAADGRLIALFIADAYDLKWSPDSQYLAIKSAYDFVQIRHVESKRIVENMKPLDIIHALDWSPDGTKIAFGGADVSGEAPEVVIVDAPMKESKRSDESRVPSEGSQTP